MLYTIHVQQQGYSHVQDMYMYVYMHVMYMSGCAYLLSNDRLLAAHLSSAVDKRRLVQVESMHLGGVLVHLSVVLLDKGLANNGRI